MVTEDIKKKPFNCRAFAAMMAWLTGLGLPVSGLILHAHSDGRIVTGRHTWSTMHVILGVLFVVFVTWHIILNRRCLIAYIRSNNAGSLLLSRETRWAVAIAAVLYIVMMTQSR
jgi:hypothetical protein